VIHYLLSILAGIAVAALARSLTLGEEHMGVVITTALGILGALLGESLSGTFSRPVRGSYLHPTGFIMAVIFASGLLYLWHSIH